MLPKKNRVSLRKEFGRIRLAAKRFDSPSFGLLVTFGARDGPLVAFVVSKKVDRRSVVRHEAKRKLADAVAPFLPRLAKTTELVFLAKQKTVTTTKVDLKSELETILKRARLL